MFDSEGLQVWLERNQIPETTRTVIDAIRTSPPSRRVGGGSSNVCGRYPSKILIRPTTIGLMKHN